MSGLAGVIEPLLGGGAAAADAGIRALGEGFNLAARGAGAWTTGHLLGGIQDRMQQGAANLERFGLQRAGESRDLQNQLVTSFADRLPDMTQAVNAEYGPLLQQLAERMGIARQFGDQGLAAGQADLDTAAAAYDRGEQFATANYQDIQRQRQEALTALGADFAAQDALIRDRRASDMAGATAEQAAGVDQQLDEIAATYGRDSPQYAAAASRIRAQAQQVAGNRSRELSLDYTRESLGVKERQSQLRQATMSAWGSEINNAAANANRAIDARAAGMVTVAANRFGMFERRAAVESETAATEATFQQAKAADYLRAVDWNTAQQSAITSWRRDIERTYDTDVMSVATMSEQLRLGIDNWTTSTAFGLGSMIAGIQVNPNAFAGFSDTFNGFYSVMQDKRAEDAAKDAGSGSGFNWGSAIMAGGTIGATALMQK